MKKETKSGRAGYKSDKRSMKSPTAIRYLGSINFNGSHAGKSFITLFS
jgi:hypothetical protein